MADSTEELELTNQEEAPAESEETTEEVVTEAAEEAAEEVAEEAEEEDERPPSRRESLRIQQLLAKLKEKENAPAPSPQNKGLDYSKTLEADEETIKTLDNDRSSYGDARYKEGLEQAKSIQFHTRLEIDAPRVEAAYPKLDPKSPQFNPVLAGSINEWYLSTVGYNAQTRGVSNANVRYSDFVESIMELADEVGSEKVARSAKNIAKQAATTGLRPDGSKAKTLNLNQAPEAMSDAELDAYIAQTIPQKSRRK